MICHIVMIRLKGSIDTEQRDAFLEKARQTLDPIPGVRNLRVGQALGSNYPHPVCLVMEFEDEASLRSYQAHSRHVRFLENILGPLLDDKQVFDYVF